MGYYRAGDFYGAGGYYRGGDPGFFDFISSAAKAVGGVVGGLAQTAGGLVPGPLGSALQMGGGLISHLAGGGGQGAAAATSPGASATGLMLGPGGRPPSLSGAGRRVLQVAPMLGTLAGRATGRAGMGRGAPRMPGRHRRINPLNPRALRRALRRAKGFEKFARRVLRITHPKPHAVHFKFPKKKKRV